MPLDQLINVISPPRLSFYESYLGYTEEESKVGAYLAFQSISSGFFPIMQMVEVGLRNAIHNVAKEHFNNDKWYLSKPSSNQSKDLVKSAVKKAKAECGKDYDSDDVVCRLTLGFWVYMLDSEYRNTSSNSYLWSPENRNKAFLNAKNPWGANLTISALFDEFHNVLKLRNRLFHHEPIWKKHNCNDVNKAVRNVKKDHKFILKTLTYLSPAKTSILECIDIPEKFIATCTTQHVDEVIKKVKENLKPSDEEPES